MLFVIHCSCNERTGRFPLAMAVSRLTCAQAWLYATCLLRLTPEQAWLLLAEDDIGSFLARGGAGSAHARSENTRPTGPASPFTQTVPGYRSLRTTPSLSVCQPQHAAARLRGVVVVDVSVCPILDFFRRRRRFRQGFYSLLACRTPRHSVRNSQQFVFVGESRVLGRFRPLRIGQHCAPELKA
jgi:hypothetical protein